MGCLLDDSPWGVRARESLLARSRCTTSVHHALQEWYALAAQPAYAPSSTCELCGKRPISYLHEIRNALNGKVLMVGSECVQQFAGGYVTATTRARKYAKDIADGKAPPPPVPAPAPPTLSRYEAAQARKQAEAAKIRADREAFDLLFGHQP